MELHVALAQLVGAHGLGLLSDAASFRGALDDFFDEDGLPAGETNLLVDCVRLGGASTFLSLTDHGADPLDAVRSAADRFARDRGGLDIATATRVCAVLAVATGRLSADAALPSTTSPVPPAPTPPPPAPAPPPQPVTASAPPPPATIPVASYPAPAGPPGRRTSPMLLVVALLAVIAGAAVATALVLGNRGDDGRAADGNTPAPPTTGSTATQDHTAGGPDTGASGSPALAEPDLVGTWSGTVTEYDADADAELGLVLVLRDALRDGVPGDVVGSTSYQLAGGTCEGRLTLTAGSTGAADLREEITAGDCIRIGRIHVAWTDGRLAFDYTSTKRTGEVQRVSGELDRAGG